MFASIYYDQFLNELDLFILEEEAGHGFNSPQCEFVLGFLM